MNVVNSKWHCVLCADSKEGGREENQDSFACVDTSFGFLFVVCDGMGGGPAGGNASMLAVQSIVMNVQKKPQGQNPKDVLYNAIVETNAFLRKNVKEHLELMGMGTTCVAVLVTQNKAIIGHVGDSRLYHLRSGKLLFRTADHSLVGEMVRKGELTEEDARRASNSNVITRSLGLRESVEPEMDIIDIKPYDRIVLCTDGVWGMMSEEELVQAFSRDGELAPLVTGIMNDIDSIGISKSNADYDNYTLGIINVNPVSKNKKTKNTAAKGSFILLLLLIVSICINIYQFSRVPDYVPTDDVNYVSFQKESNNVDAPQQVKNDDDGLDYKFEKKKNEQLRDSISLLLKKLETADNNQNGKNPKVLKRIINNLKKLNTSKGNNIENILKNKRDIQKSIINDFGQLRKQREKVRLVDLEKKLKSNTIIETQKDGASTPKAKKLIKEVSTALESL